MSDFFDITNRRSDKKARADIRALGARVDNIIAHNNDTEGNSELVDIRTGADGTVYESAGDAVREQFAFADRKITSLKKGLLGITDAELQWRQGALNTATGVESNTNWEICTGFFQTTTDTLTVKVNNGYIARLFKFTNEDAFVEYTEFRQNTTTTVTVSRSSKYRLILRSLTSTITPQESGNVVIYEEDIADTLRRQAFEIQHNNRKTDCAVSVINSVLESGSYVFPIEWEMGTFNNSTGEKTPSSNIIRSSEKINVRNLSRQIYLSIVGQYSANPAIRCYTYDKDGNFLGYISASVSLKRAILNDDVAYINIYVTDYATSTSTDYCDGIFFYTKKSSTIMTRCADQIENIAAGCASDRHTFGKKNFALLMFSDLHSDTERMKNAVELLNSCDMIDAAINLGDTCGAEPSVSGFGNYVSITNNAKKPLLTVMGNHDERVYENTDITVEDCVGNFIALTDEAACYSERGYGYKDFDNYKIRIIVLNSFDYPNNQDSLGKYIYYGSQPMYLKAQIDWLIETLNSVPENYTVIVAAHITEPVQCDETKIPQHLSTINRPDANAVLGTCGFMSDTIISDIIEAYRNKALLNKSYTYSRQTANLTGIEVDADFSAASGDFACYICGHTHNQAIGKIYNHENQVVYFNDSSRGLINNSSWTQAYSLIPRTIDGKGQDLVTILCVDTENKNLNFIRVGAHLSMYMEDYNMLNYPYQ